MDIDGLRPLFVARDATDIRVPRPSSWSVMKISDISDFDTRQRNTARDAVAGVNDI